MSRRVRETTLGREVLLASKLLIPCCLLYLLKNGSLSSYLTC
jgi:hypothetical protein